MGYQPIISVMSEKGSSILNIACTGESTPLEVLQCQDQHVVVGATMFWLLLAGVLATLLTGFSAMYVIPIIILIAVLEFFMFPLSFLFSLPDLLLHPILAFFNIITALSVINFVRGGA